MSSLLKKNLSTAKFFCKPQRRAFGFECADNFFPIVRLQKNGFHYHDEHLIYLYQTFQNLEKEAVFDWIYDIIAEYGLSLVSRKGYEFYGCDSGVGLGDYNRKAFHRLREVSIIVLSSIIATTL